MSKRLVRFITKTKNKNPNIQSKLLINRNAIKRKSNKFAPLEEFIKT